MVVNSKDDISILNEIFNKLNLNNILSISKTVNQTYTVFLASTSNKRYLIKQYKKKFLINEKNFHLNKNKLNIAENLNNNGVPYYLPLKFQDKFFIIYNNYYYLIYNKNDYIPTNYLDITPKKIKKAAKNLAIIHKLNIPSSLPCPYKKINISYNEYLPKIKSINDKLFKAIYDNYFYLETITKECNKNLQYNQNILCTSPNNYTKEKILWNKDYMYLEDYEDLYLLNPTISLIESAFSFSIENNKLNLEIFKIFIKSYLKKYGSLISDFKTSLYVAPNNRLIKLENKLKKLNKITEEEIKETINIINELTLYKKEFENMNKIYIEMSKNIKKK